MIIQLRMQKSVSPNKVCPNNLSTTINQSHISNKLQRQDLQDLISEQLDKHCIKASRQIRRNVRREQ